ncbi:hypothetical protein Lfu02_02840 [Longispora fulva]|uniref:Peptidase inhibitor family I36 n=1 Tax=Longispora fulva TaxID=619741 RepID=A0A8J7KI54_9ACTN|nr:hypothetical protein [Longispora fulva]MBG6135844.1 hypothetical protein [Longispora fulva]GIG55912.1 hypothetical protein Lfu02_02840 [Longispora fulva]
MRLKSAIATIATLAATVAPFAAAGTAHASANGPSGCNNNVCIYTSYTGTGWRVWGEFRSGAAEGHIDFWGPNGFHASSPNGYWTAGGDTQAWSGSGNGQLCAQGWSRANGTWSSVGLPCVAV